MKRLALILVFCFVLGACAPSQKKVTPVPALSPLPQEEVAQPEENPGSLFKEGEVNLLFADSRARQVGDIVVVNIVETVSAKNKASTKADKESTLNLGVTNFFGQQNMRAVPVGSVLGFGPNLGPRAAVGSTPLVKASSASTFDGSGETKRESDITASIAARVVKVLSNGLLQIEGAREIRVNGETQIIVVRGLARTKDIAADNSISSNYLADAKIEIYGEGILADKQKPGWLTRLLDNIWPF
ncbi:MAG: Flagellar L-ring protein [Desulfonauticus sp. 38_4375]|nr:MAG: Flagellar L-ring protein [Desulfonauticus sp. 38_4375]